MYKVMIIDDDIPVLKYMEEFIHWSELGLEIVYKTASSIDGLEALDKFKPDVILLDIGMPEINGLEFAIMALEKNPYVRIIFLTCHKEFSFVKKALQLKADDYLIKDELTPEKLKSSLTKAISQIKEQKELKKNILENFKINNVHFLKQVFMSELTNKRNADILAKSISRFNQTWNQPDFRLMIGHLPLNQDYLNKNFTLTVEELYHVLSQFFADNDRFEVFLAETEVLILMNFKSSIKFNVYEYLEKCLKEAAKFCKQQLKVDVMFIPLMEDLKLEQLGEKYEKMTVERNRLFYEEYQLIHPIDLKEAYSFVPIGNLLEFTKRELRKKIKLGETSELNRMMGQIKETLYSNNVDPNDVVREFIHFISLTEVRTRHFEEADLFAKKIQATWLIEEALDIFKTEIITLAEQNQPDLPTTTDAQNIQKVDKYIMKNMDKKIRAVDMANHLYLNPSYFSRYFKRITGYTFTDYVNKYKMTAASRFLLNSEEPIESVGEKVGFYERTYFSKVFKKYIGKSPSEYRNHHKII